MSEPGAKLEKPTTADEPGKEDGKVEMVTLHGVVRQKDEEIRILRGKLKGYETLGEFDNSQQLWLSMRITLVYRSLS